MGSCLKQQNPCSNHEIHVLFDHMALRLKKGLFLRPFFFKTDEAGRFFFVLFFLFPPKQMRPSFFEQN